MGLSCYLAITMRGRGSLVLYTATTTLMRGLLITMLRRIHQVCSLQHSA